MSTRRSPLAMALLSLVCEEPMHAYRMQQMIKERHKDDVVNVAQRNSVYQTIERLRRDGLITVRETSREENRPERTVYQPSDAGRETLRRWMREMLSAPAREFPEFPAALAFLPVLDPGEARAALEERVAALRARLAGLDRDLTEGAKFLPRLFLLETEYMRAMAATELDHVRGLVANLAAGEVTWDYRL
ncbi:PadR family transcriptional regulator [Sphaerisporangium sp. TRM90804]|uniref:PadR family transcriptional regulator n=1 Tax=Sphaerisporangium sp. TRM90804 TaxID=3031113 RepID=UPI00244B47D8|nr:PadR family transcriptional regulator [Sphaerisporangium sp. TRM90804]MDH2426894.1 PadR family transcriptional regulator [Sphaerisporangium sp. TRM90804]